MSKCSHPKAIAFAPDNRLTAEQVDALGERLAQGTAMLEWQALVVTGEIRLEFPECSWCRKPRWRFW